MDHNDLTAMVMSELSRQTRFDVGGFGRYLSRKGQTVGASAGRHYGEMVSWDKCALKMVSVRLSLPVAGCRLLMNYEKTASRKKHDSWHVT